MVETTLILIRHAHTEANEAGHELTMSGWADTPVSERGRQELACLARVDAASIAPEAGPIASVVYCSDRVRALETARAIARGRRIVRLRSLREIDCGDVDGWSVDRVRSRYPDLWNRNMEQDDSLFRWPGGETYREFRTRSLRAIRGIAARHPGERVVVVTHTGVIAELVGAIRGISPARWEAFRPGNCSITTIVWEGAAGRILALDDRRHLEDA